jgi:hypothetical protein
MAQLEADIARARQTIERLRGQIEEQERLLHDMEQDASRFGVDSDGGREARRAFEAELAKQRQTIRALRKLLDDETRRLQRLESAFGGRRG